MNAEPDPTIKDTAQALVSPRVATRILQMKIQTLIAAVFLIPLGIHRNVNL
jgi:hypothetical protein